MCRKIVPPRGVVKRRADQDPQLGEWLEKFDRGKVEAAREFWYQTLMGIDESLREFF